MTQGLETYTIDSFINQRLVNDAALLALLADGNQGIHNELAPEGAKRPMIVFWPLVPGNDVRVVGPQRVGTWSQIIVAGEVQAGSQAPLRDIATRIDADLHNPPPTTMPDGIVYASVRVSVWRRTEVTGGLQYRQLGGIYKILAQG